MSTVAKPIIIATRGSALALAQANLVFDQCRAAFPKLESFVLGRGGLTSRMIR